MAKEKKEIPLPEEEIHKLASLLFEHIEGQIHFGDNKAQITIGINAVLMGTFAAFSKGLVLSLFGPAPTATAIITAAAILLLFLSICLSVYFALNATQPMMSLMRRKTETKATDNLFFFGSIHALPPEDFTDQFKAQTRGSANEAILGQVHAKARIAQRKFESNRRSISFLYASLILWIIIQVLLAFQP